MTVRAKKAESVCIAKKVRRIGVEMLIMKIGRGSTRNSVRDENFVESDSKCPTETSINQHRSY